MAKFMLWRKIHMAINYSPRVGEVLECDFGMFKTDVNGDIDSKNFDGRIPPEMVKKRLVVVLNGKMNNACIVVPISSKKDLGEIGRGFHVLLEPSLISTTSFYDVRDRWAKANLAQQVSKQRLFKITDRGSRIPDYCLPRNIIEIIQRAIVKAVSASSLLPPALPPKVMPEVIPEAIPVDIS